MQMTSRFVFFFLILFNNTIHREEGDLTKEIKIECLTMIRRYSKAHFENFR